MRRIVPWLVAVFMLVVLVVSVAIIGAVGATCGAVVAACTALLLAVMWIDTVRQLLRAGRDRRRQRPPERPGALQSRIAESPRDLRGAR